MTQSKRAQKWKRTRAFSPKWSEYGKWFNPRTNTLWYRDWKSFYENS